MNGLCLYYSMLLLKEYNRAQPSWRKNSFRKISIDPHLSLGAPWRPWIPYPLASWVLSGFLSPEPTPLQGWESLPCSSRPTARSPGGLQMQTRTCRVGCTLAEYPAQLEGSHGRCWSGGCRKWRKEEVILLASPTLLPFPRRSSRCHQTNFSRLEWKL